MSEDEQKAFDEWLGEGQTALLSVHSNPMMMRRDIASRAFVAGIAYKQAEVVKAIEASRPTRPNASASAGTINDIAAMNEMADRIKRRITGASEGEG